jgi:hypothetical protein
MPLRTAFVNLTIVIRLPFSISSLLPFDASMLHFIAVLVCSMLLFVPFPTLQLPLSSDSFQCFLGSLYWECSMIISFGQFHPNLIILFNLFTLLCYSLAIGTVTDFGYSCVRNVI